MSKIGKKVITIPSGVDISVDNNGKVSVKWPKGQLSYTLLPWVSAIIADNQITVSVDSEEKKNLRWLSRTLIDNMVEGVTKWFEKKLLVMWVWYSAKLEGKNIKFTLGLSHPVFFSIPDGIEVKIEQDVKWNYIITLNGIDKQYLGEVTANIRALKIPEPYKWKWIRYFDEVIKLKAGKSAKK